MRFYAERPARLARQLLADVLVVVWVVLCVRLARGAAEVVRRLQEPGLRLADAGGTVRDAFVDAARTADVIPLIGDDLARALSGGAGAGDALAAAGQDQVATVATLATGTTVAVVLVGALPVVLVWLLLRLRYARAAGSAVAIRRYDDGDLLALRALSNRPVRALLGVSADPAAAWRYGDRAAVHRLAELELRSLGLRLPAAGDRSKP